MILRRTLLIAVSMLAAITYSASAPDAQSSTQTTTTSTTTTSAELIAHRAAVHLWRHRVRRHRILAVHRAYLLGLNIHPGPVERQTDRVRRLERLNHHFRRRASYYRAVIRRRFPKLLCIHHYEGGWTAYNAAGYFGGFQMDAGFMERWGADKLRKYGGRDARYWSPADQLAVASRAVAHIGFGSWPNTAAMCGLL